MTPDFLVVGHIVKDITTSGWRPGGSVYYAAAQARRLGLGVAAVTSCASDPAPPAILADIHWRVVPSAQTTTFENRYADARRTQRVLARAMPLCLEDIPHDWRAAPPLLPGPVFHDVAASLPALLTRPGALVGLGAQGWLRSLEDDHVKPGRVEPAAPRLAGGRPLPPRPPRRRPRRLGRGRRGRGRGRGMEPPPAHRRPDAGTRRLHGLGRPQPPGPARPPPRRAR